MTREWQPEHGKLDHGKFVGDGCYGLGGVCLVANRPGARAWSEFTPAFSSLEVDYWEQPSGGSFEVVVDGTVTGTIKTHGAQPVSAFKSFDVPEGPHKVELRAKGDGDVRVFGVSLDRSQIGVVYDALGINGARASTTLHWNEAHMAEQLRHRAADLVVLAYGTNERADDGPLDPDRASARRRARPHRARRAHRIMSRDGTARPCGGDAERQPLRGERRRLHLGDVAEARPGRRARAQGRGRCGLRLLRSKYAAMGELGHHRRRVERSSIHPRAQRDRTHLTRDGYALLAFTFATDVLNAYGSWRIETGLGPGKQRAPVAPPPTLNPPEEVVPPPVNTASQAPFVAIPL